MASLGNPRILSIGECMVELSPAGNGTYTLGYAGDTLNTAWYLRQELPAEAEVGYFTCVGTDDISAKMLAFLESAGIETAAISRLTDRTLGLYLIELTNGERSFAYWRSTSAAKLLAADEAPLRRALQGIDMAYFSGITLAILSPEHRKTLLGLLREARQAGTKIVFDPNLRPRLWASQSEMCAEISRAATVADIVLPSFEDEASAFGDKTPLDTARRYAEGGAALVVAKNGAGEMAAISQGNEPLLWTPPAVTKVVDTTAAGDSFNAGFLAAHLAGKTLPESLTAGAKLAAKVIGHRGALIPMGADPV